MKSKISKHIDANQTMFPVDLILGTGTESQIVYCYLDFHLLWKVNLNHLLVLK